MANKKPKTPKQEQIKKKLTPTEEGEAVTQERTRLLNQIAFLNDWANTLQRQLMGYRDTMTMIGQKREELIQKLSVLNEPLPKMETNKKA